jgi:hypothetical protein
MYSMPHVSCIPTHVKDNMARAMYDTHKAGVYPRLLETVCESAGTVQYAGKGYAKDLCLSMRRSTAHAHPS